MGKSYSNANKVKVVLLDDEEDFANVLKVYFEQKEDIEFNSFSNSDNININDILNKDIIFLDLNWGKKGDYGWELLKELRKKKFPGLIFILSQYDDDDYYEKAALMEVDDYITKHAVADWQEYLNNNITPMIKKFKVNKDKIEEADGKIKFIGSSLAIRKLKNECVRAESSDTPVLILGETGVGKEVVAEYIAYLYNEKRNYVPVNINAITPTLLDAELFGSEKGSYTGAEESRDGLFQEADKGVLFLDEIGDLELNLQTKLLRAIENKEIKKLGKSKVSEINVKVIAATNKDINALIEEGKFREDLFRRFGVVIRIPPLKERKEDIEELVKHFVEKFNGNINIDNSIITKIKNLDYEWNGNIRELGNFVERMCVNADSMGRENITLFDFYKIKVELLKERNIGVPSVLQQKGKQKKINEFKKWKKEVKVLEDAIREFINKKGEFSPHGKEEKEWVANQCGWKNSKTNLVSKYHTIYNRIKKEKDNELLAWIFPVDPWERDEEFSEIFKKIK